jgi:glycosyltransferase involved in cell wall biosynthesis
MPLRVAVDATPLVGSRTGVGAFVGGMLPALAHRSDVDLVAYGLTWQGRAELPGMLPPGVALARPPMPAGPLLRAWGRADGPAVEWWTGPVDVVHGTNFVVPPSRRGGEVVTVHDLTAIRFPELCTPTSLAYPALVRRAMARGAWIHTPSEFVRREVIDLLQADPDRVRAIAHGVTPAMTPPPSHAAVTASTDPNKGKRYVLSLGTAEPRKDLPGLVRAFDAIAGARPGVHLVIAGPRGWGEADLVAAITASPYRNRITRLGWVDDIRRRNLIGGAAVLAYPSIYEGFGFPPLEAMAAGVPVVTTRAGAVPETVGDAARLVDTGDVDALAAALAAALDEDGDARASTVARGKAHAARFTWEACAGGLVALYESVAVAAAHRG